MVDNHYQYLGIDRWSRSLACACDSGLSDVETGAALANNRQESYYLTKDAFGRWLVYQDHVDQVITP